MPSLEVLNNLDDGDSVENSISTGTTMTSAYTYAYLSYSEHDHRFQCMNMFA